MARARFTKAEIARAIAGAQDRALDVRGVEIGADGTIRVLTSEAATAQPSELDEWRARKNARRAAQGT